MKRELRLTRSAGKKAPKVSILIVTEGENTEPLYFEELKKHLGISNRLVEVKVEGDRPGSAPMSVVKCAIEMQEERKADVGKSPMTIEYDNVWCVFDTEVNRQHPRIDTAVELALGHEISIAMSNPSFEYWLLLHFSQTSRGFNSNPALVKELKKSLPKYDKKKNNAAIFTTVLDKTDTAISNAKSALRSHDCEGEVDLCNHNSSTNVHLLVQQLQKLSK